MLDFLNQHGGLLPEPLAAHLFRQIVDAVRCPRSEAHASDLRHSNPHHSIDTDSAECQLPKPQCR